MLLDLLESAFAQFEKFSSGGVLRLDGGTPVKRRQELCEAFNGVSLARRGDFRSAAGAASANAPNANVTERARPFVFLISTRAGGVGLNLQAANKVVVVDPDWNPVMDLQAQDRAYRMGNRHARVDVFRLIAAGTIDHDSCAG